MDIQELFRSVSERVQSSASVKAVYGEPIMAYSPSSSGARAYQNLTVELLRGDGWQIPQKQDLVERG